MLIAIGKVIDKNSMIEGLRVYDTKSKISKDIRIESIPKEVKNLNQASRLGAVNINNGEVKPVVLIEVDNSTAKIVNVNGEERIINSLNELKTYKIIKIKTDIELYEEYIQRSEDTRLKFKVEKDKVSIIHFESKSRDTEMVVIPTFVSEIEGFTFKDVKAKNLKVSSNNIMIDSLFNVFNKCKSEYIDLSNFNFRTIEHIFGMMYGCTNLKKADLRNMTGSSITNLQSVFTNCSRLKEVDISNLDTSNVVYMNSMFEGCTNLETVKLGKFRTDNLISVTNMFKNCKKLIYIKWGAELNISNVDCNSMFYGCESLKTLSISKMTLDGTKRSRGTDYTFYGCKNLIDIGNVEYINCKSAISMFEGCKSLERIKFLKWIWNIDISADIRKFEDILSCCDNMFKDCSKLQTVNLGTLSLIYQHRNINGVDWEPISMNFKDTFKDCKSLRIVSLGGYHKGIGYTDDTINKIMIEKHKDDMKKHSKMGKRVEIHIK